MKTKILLTSLLILLTNSLVAQKREASFFSVKNPEKTFVGAVLDPKSINTDNHQFVSITVSEPITLSFSLPVKSTKIVPTYDNMIKAIKGGVAENGKLNPKQSFSYNIKEIRSYDELSWYFGQSMNIATFWGIDQNSKPSKTTILVDLTQEFFNVVMDIPDDGKLYNKDPEIRKRGNELIYVGSLSFGRKVTVLVSSDAPYGVLKPAIEAAINAKNKPLNVQNRTILSNADVRIMVLGNATLSTQSVDNPFVSVIEYFHRPVTGEDFGSPIKMSASHIKDNSDFVNRY